MKLNDDLYMQIVEAKPPVLIELIIRNKLNQVLLCKRKNLSIGDCWFVPGGRIHKNELLEKALKRIAQQKLGCELKLCKGHLLGAYNHSYQDKLLGIEGLNTNYVVLGYEFVVQNDFAVVTDEQHLDLTWMAIDDALTRDDVHDNTKAYFISRYEDAK